jgi:predicted RNase H-like HicB family nuclease
MVKAKKEAIVHSILWPVELKMNIEIELEDDGRWIAKVPDLLGVMADKGTREDALTNAEAIECQVGSL